MTTEAATATTATTASPSAGATTSSESSASSVTPNADNTSTRIDHAGGFEERAQAMRERYAAEDDAERAARARSESDDDGEAKPKPKPAPADGEEPPLAASDPAAARKERLAAMRAKEAERRKAAEARGEGEATSKRLRELETTNGDLAQKAAELEALKDPARFMEVAKKYGADAGDLADYLRSAADPTTAAAKAARAELDPALATLNEKLAANERALEELRAEKRAEQQRAAEASARTALLSAVKPNDHPLCSALRSTLGDEQLIVMATALGRTLGEDAGIADLVDVIEEHLETYANLSKPTPSTTSTTPQSAAAKAPPLTNRAASGRTTVVDPEEEPMTLEERAERFKRKYRAYE